MDKNKKMLNVQLAQIRTLLSNQRTHLSYIRTGIVISMVAIKLKSNLIIALGMLIINFGVYQYYTTAKTVENGEIVYPNKEIPLSFTIIGLLLLYYYWHTQKTNEIDLNTTI